jgi:hypothetical protein
MPGENPAVFGDALRRLAAAATYLYAEGARYWYSTQPTVTKLAEDRAEQYRRNTDAVVEEIGKRLKVDLRAAGDFRRIHIMPPSGADVQDDMEARLVVLAVDYPYSKDADNKAEAAAKAILQSRGNSPRLFQNTLIFLAVDKIRLQDLDEAVRRYLAWRTICEDSNALNLDPQQVRQAETQQGAADGAVLARMPEAYQWLLVPVQDSPQEPMKWEALRLSGPEGLAIRASKKLRAVSLFASSFAGTELRRRLDKIPLWRGDHVSVRQLAEDFARYTYLDRLAGPEVLAAAVRDGLASLVWQKETFAYADSFDETNGRYRGLRCGQAMQLSYSDEGLLVKPAVAQRQQEEDAKDFPPPVTGGTPSPRPPEEVEGDGKSDPESPKPATRPRRYFGKVELDATRVGRDAGRIAEEVIAHLAGLVGSTVTVTLEIEAKVPDGAPDNVVRTVTENSRTLGFSSQGFERE